LTFLYFLIDVQYPQCGPILRQKLYKMKKDEKGTSNFKHFFYSK